MSAQTAPSASTLARSSLAWMATNTRQVATTAILGFAFAWLLNIALMVVRYEGYQVTSGAPVTGQGSLVSGSAFWFIASMILFGLVGYRRAVGPERFWSELKGLPSTASSLVRADGAHARVHLLWGFAVSLLIQQVLSPALSGLFAVGLFVALPSVVGRMVVGLGYRVVSTGFARIAPGRELPVPSATTLAVGMLGAIIAFAVGLFVDGRLAQLVLALVAAGLAWVVSSTGTSAGTAAGLLAMAIGVAGLLDVVPALADDGGWEECGETLRAWLTCGDGGQVRLALLGLIGGVAGGAGGPAGLAIGHLVGQGWGEGPAGPDGDGKDGPPDGGGDGPVVIDENGERLVVHDGSYEGGKEGQVWYGNGWMDPEDARAAIAHEKAQRAAVKARADRAQAEVRADTVGRASELQAEADAEAAVRATEQAEFERQQSSFREAELIERYAKRHGYEDILERFDDHAYDEDGNFDPDYVQRLGDVLSNRIRGDQAFPDEEAERGWIGEFAEETWDDATHNPAVRIGLGILTGGSSEVGFQTQAMYERIREAEAQAAEMGLEYGGVDAVLDALDVLYDENVPKNTLEELLREGDPDESMLDRLASLGGSAAVDVLQILDLKQTGKSLREGLEAGGKRLRPLTSGEGVKGGGDGGGAAGADEVAKRSMDWNRNKLEANRSVDDFESAQLRLDNARRSGDPAELAAAKKDLREATLQVQGNKSALQQINQRFTKTRQDFNDSMREVYDGTDRDMLEWVRRESGFGGLEEVPRKQVELDTWGEPVPRVFRDAHGNEVHIAEPTNPSSKPKVGADRDYTMRTKRAGENVATDVPASRVQEQYNESFLKNAQELRADDGRLLTEAHAEVRGSRIDADGRSRTETPEEFAERMDQVGTDAGHTESYGTSKADLETAINRPDRPFSDPKQVGKAVAYKGNHWFERAEQARQAGDGAKAEDFMAEGMRQVRKQADNQMRARAGALRDQGFDVQPPERLEQAVETMRQVEEGRISPAQAESGLKDLGYDSPTQVAGDVGGQIEVMQELRPRLDLPVEEVMGDTFDRYRPPGAAARSALGDEQARFGSISGDARTPAQSVAKGAAVQAGGTSFPRIATPQQAAALSKGGLTKPSSAFPQFAPTSDWTKG